MTTYSMIPVKLIGGYYERCAPDDPQAVWSIYSCDDENHPWLHWIADVPTREMAMALADALERGDSERGRSRAQATESDKRGGEIQ